MPATPEEIARRALADHLAARPSSELLRRYADRRDPEAFAGLVQQFGPMVLGVCRRVLGCSADVDDAFQAVFLSLARQADSFRDPAALPAWLHRVALRVAHKALARRATASAPPDTVPDPADPFAEVAWKDVRRTLDEELDALPDKYRGPVVLCWLDGLTQDEATRRLGVSLATLKRRLDAGRELLRSRLVQRGLAPALAAAAVLDATGLRAVVPEAVKVLAVGLGVGSAVPTGLIGLEVLVSAAGPSRRTALAVVLSAGTAGGLVYALMRTPRPPEPVIPPLTPEESVAVAPMPRPRLGPLQFEPIGKPLPLAVLGANVHFTRDGRTLVSDGLIAPRAWNLTTGTRLYERPLQDGAFQEHEFDEMFVGPGDASVVIGTHRVGLRILRYDFADASTWQPEFDGGANPPLAVSPDGNTFATGGFVYEKNPPRPPDAAWNGIYKQPEPVLKLWDASNWWKPHPRKPEWPGYAGWPQWTLRNPRVLPSLRASVMAFSPDGSLLAGAGRNSVSLLEVKTGARRQLGTIHALNRVRIAFSPDGRWLAAADWSTEKTSVVKVWNLIAETERTLVATEQPNEGYFSLAFHPDGRTLVVGHRWGSIITQWDVATGANRGTLIIPPTNDSDRRPEVWALAFSPDGNTLAATRQQNVYLWKVSRRE